MRALADVVILGGQGRPPFGVLQVDSRRPRRFTDEDVAFLRGYASLVAAAVDRPAHWPAAPDPAVLRAEISALAGR